MEDFFAKFIREEYEWIFDDAYNVAMLLEGFEDRISEDEFYEHYNEFMDKATMLFCNDEYVIQTIHEYMDDSLRDVLKGYLNKK
jgi:hypothetical protein